jgi:hypothetical protein
MIPNGEVCVLHKYRVGDARDRDGVMTRRWTPRSHVCPTVPLSPIGGPVQWLAAHCRAVLALCKARDWADKSGMSLSEGVYGAIESGSRGGRAWRLRNEWARVEGPINRCQRTGV